MKISYQEYLQNAHKNTPQVYFDYIYRKLSHPLSYLFIRLNITPNQIALSQTFLYIYGAFLVIQNYIILGIIIFMISYLLDFCDGNVARAVIKYKGIPEVTKKKGMILEPMNTNVFLLSFYFSLGYYLWNQTGEIYLFVLAFLTLGTKMVMRYTENNASGMFMNDQERVESLKNVKKKYHSSVINKIKFLLRKSLFAANFYLVVYLIVFIFFPSYAWLVFIVYAGLDTFFNLFRIVNIFVRKY